MQPPSTPLRKDVSPEEVFVRLTHNIMRSVDFGYTIGANQAHLRGRQYRYDWADERVYITRGSMEFEAGALLWALAVILNPQARRNVPDAHLVAETVTQLFEKRLNLQSERNRGQTIFQARRTDLADQVETIARTIAYGIGMHLPDGPLVRFRTRPAAIGQPAGPALLKSNTLVTPPPATPAVAGTRKVY
jgi:hypothetical protein